MKLFDLIIQRTKDGLEEEYISENLKLGNLNSEIEETLKDERRTATKLANQSDVYSIQITKNYRVYSLIVTKIIDNQKRAGFYAIRLYAPKRNPLADFQARLHKINKKYIEYERNAIPKDSQDYSDTLQYLPLEVKQQDFISVQSNEEAFCFFESSNTQLSNEFNDKSIALFNKVYAFNQDVAVSKELIQSLGLKSLEEKRQNLKEVRITNNDRVLNELKINNVPISFKADDGDFTVILKKNDLLEYNTKDNPKFKQDTSLIINVQRKHYANPSPPTRGSKKPGFFETYGIYFIMIAMIAMLGFGSWYFFLKEDAPIQENQEEFNEQQLQVNNQTIKFIKISEGSPMDSIYTTNFPKLEKYRFQFINKKWRYKNTEGKNIYNDFYVNDLDEIIKKDSINISADLKLEFLNNLKVISGHEIIKKEDSKNNADEISKAEQATKKESVKSKPIEKNKEIKTKTKINTSDNPQSDVKPKNKSIG